MYTSKTGSQQGPSWLSESTSENDLPDKSPSGPSSPTKTYMQRAVELYVPGEDPTACKIAGAVCMWLASFITGGVLPAILFTAAAIMDCCTKTPSDDTSKEGLASLVEDLREPQQTSVRVSRLSIDDDEGESKFDAEAIMSITPAAAAARVNNKEISQDDMAEAFKTLPLGKEEHPICILLDITIGSEERRDDAALLRIATNLYNDWVKKNSTTPVRPSDEELASAGVGVKGRYCVKLIGKDLRGVDDKVMRCLLLNANDWTERARVRTAAESRNNGL